MSKLIFNGVMLGAVLAFFSCQNQTNTENLETVNTDSVTVAAVENCTYNFNKENTVLKWTAYKTTEKLGVSGEFSSYEVSGTEESSSAEGAVVGAKVVIPVATVVTGDEGRDNRIIEYFFGKFIESDTLFATVKEFNADGSGVLSVKMNGIEKDLAFTGTIDGDKIETSTDLNLEDFDGQEAVSALNEACGDLHAGADGITKLWPDVKIEIVTRLDKACE